MTRAFTARKVDELEFAGHQVFYITVVYNLSLKCENGMRATRRMIKVMRSHNFILNSFVIQLYCVLGIVASKYKQVFNRELVIFRPPDFESFLFLARLIFLEILSV